jgi:hypothetical protein
MEKLVRDLTLILLYLTSWIEDDGLGQARRSWKGYPFEVLDALAEEGLLAGSRRAKSVWLTEEGEEAAKFLLKYYGLEFSEQKKTRGRVVPLPKQKK